jgi:hypothetical protein
LAKSPSSSSSLHGKQGSGGTASAAADSGGLGLGGGRDAGEKRQGVQGSDPRPHLERRWRVAAWPRRPAAVGGGVRGGGAAAEERGLGVAAEFVGVEERHWGSFYRRARRWSGAGRWPSSELRGRP